MRINKDYMQVVRLGKWRMDREKIRKSNESGIIVAIGIICALLLILIASVAHADDIAGYTSDQWANAIYKTEGVNSKYPYGIKSIRARNALEARKICKRTISHYWRDYQATIKQRSLAGFVEYTSNRYCPFSCDPIGNLNWKHNMYILMRKE